MKNESDYILLGRIVGVHGVRGWVKLHSECRPREKIFQYKQFVLKNEHTQETIPVSLKASREQGKGLVAQFAGYDDRDKAHALINHTIWLQREQLPELADDEFYWHDLIGLQVSNLAQEYLGEVSSLFETGANDVLVVETQKQTLLIPFIIDHYIMDIDLHEKTITVDWQRDWSDPSSH